MTYTTEQIDRYAHVLAFSCSPELFASLHKQDRKLSEEITQFHIIVSILGAVEYVSSLDDKITIASLRNHIQTNILKNSSSIVIETKLEIYIPIAVENNLLTEELLLTDLGKYMIEAKLRAFHISNTASINPN